MSFRSIVFLMVAMLIPLTVTGAEPPAPKAPTFGLGTQECPDGYCPIQTEVRSPLFGLRSQVTRTRTRTRQFLPPVTTQVQSIPQPMTVARTEWVEEEVEVPVQRMVTVMEKRTVRKPVSVLESIEVAQPVCPCLSTVSWDVQSFNEPMVVWQSGWTVNRERRLFRGRFLRAVFNRSWRR